MHCSTISQSYWQRNGLYWVVIQLIYRQHNSLQMQYKCKWILREIIRSANWLSWHNKSKVLNKANNYMVWGEGEGSRYKNPYRTQANMARKINHLVHHWNSTMQNLVYINEWTFFKLSEISKKLCKLCNFIQNLAKNIRAIGTNLSHHFFQNWYVNKCTFKFSVVLPTLIKSEYLTPLALHYAYLANTFTGLLEINIFSLLAVHTKGNLGVITFIIFLKLQPGHVVKQLG